MSTIELGVAVRALALAVVATVAVTVGGEARAADAEGSYAVRGAGAHPCETFVSAAAGDEHRAALFIAWIEGYVSAVNRFQDDTFDSAPVLAGGQMGAIVLNVCRSSPQMRFETAVAAVLNTFASARVRRDSPVLDVDVAGRSVSIRRETLLRIQDRLREKGLYSMASDGLFGPGTQRALRAFQESEGLEVTQIPDTDTLIRLLIAR